MRPNSLALLNLSFQGIVANLTVSAAETHDPKEHFKVKCGSLIMLLY